MQTDIQIPDFLSKLINWRKCSNLFIVNHSKKYKSKGIASKHKAYNLKSWDKINHKIEHILFLDTDLRHKLRSLISQLDYILYDSLLGGKIFFTQMLGNFNGNIPNNRDRPVRHNLIILHRLLSFVISLLTAQHLAQRWKRIFFIWKVF